MSRVNFITHEGKRMLHIDFSNCTVAELRPVMNEARRIIELQAPNSLLTLTDVTGARFDDPTAKALQEYSAQNRPYVRAAAVVGASGLRRIVLNTIKLVTRRELATFDGLDEAKRWLATH